MRWSSVVVLTGGSSYHWPRGSCSHSTTLQKYNPLSPIRACRIVKSKLGPSLRIMLIRCPWLDSTWGPNVTPPSRSDVKMVMVLACCWTSQVTAKREVVEVVWLTEHVISMSVLIFPFTAGVEARTRLLAKRGRHRHKIAYGEKKSTIHKSLTKTTWSLMTVRSTWILHHQGQQVGWRNPLVSVL